jgi:preprotein translocase subunit SecF
MQFLDGTSKINFMGKHKFAYAFSITLILISIGSLVTRGLNLGLDFTGGYLIEVGYENDADIQPIRNVLESNGYKDAEVQHFGSARDVLIRIAPRKDINKTNLSDNIIALLKTKTDQNITLRRVEFVGPQVGEDLRDQGGLAMLVAILGIMIYVGFRFEFKSALGSILALVHDVIITTGAFSITHTEFDLTALAAILAVIGYSLNDTVVVLDRVRETFRAMRKGTPEDVLNLSINQTLSRTLMTSLTTILVVLALFFLGGEIIHGFAFALLVGIGIGTYSSIYVASSILLTMGIKKQDFLVQTKDQVVDDRP